MSRNVQTLVQLAGLAVGLWLLSRSARSQGLPVPPPAAFPDQADSPFGGQPGEIPQVIY